MSQRYVIDAVDPATAETRHEVFRLASGTLPGLNATGYAKYYLENPHGQAILLFAHHRSTEPPIGMAAVFPWQLLIGNEAWPGGLVGGFAVTQEHRGLGPAIALQRAVVTAASDADMTFVYGAPNQQATPIFRRLRYHFGPPFTRLVRPMSTRLAATYFGWSRMPASVASAADAALRLVAPERWRARKTDGRVDSITHFDEAYEPLWNLTFKQHGVRGPRTADLLNWRFGFDQTPPGPGRQFRGVVLHRHGPRAYAVWYEKDDVRHIVDVAAASANDLESAMAALLTDASRARCLAVSLAASGRDEIVDSVFRRMGFVHWQEQLASVIRWTSPSHRPRELTDDNSWFLVPADIDV